MGQGEQLHHLGHVTLGVTIDSDSCARCPRCEPEWPATSSLGSCTERQHCVLLAAQCCAKELSLPNPSRADGCSVTSASTSASFGKACQLEFSHDCC